MTFDAYDDCPKCGRSRPAPLVTVPARRKLRRGRGGASYLSSLTLSPIHRFFGGEGDSEVVSLLGETTELVSAPASDVDQPPSVMIDPGSGADDSPIQEENVGLESGVEDGSEMGEMDFAEDLFLDDAKPAEGIHEEEAGVEEEAGDQSEESAIPDEEEGGGLEEVDVAVGDEPGQEDADESSPDMAAGDAASPDASDEEGEEDADALWAEAFAEQEAAEAGGSPEAAGETGTEVEAGAAQEADPGGDDDISGMWDEAFAEQEAAEKTAEEQGGVSATQGESEFSDINDTEMEKLWDEALTDSESAGEEPAAPSEEEPAGESAGEDSFSGEIVSQEDLDALLAGTNEKIEDEGGSGDVLRNPERPEIDEEEIEAYVLEEGEGGEALADREGGLLAGEPAGGGGEEATLLKRLVAGLADAGVVGGLEVVFMAGTHIIISRMAGPIFANMEALALVLALDLVVLFLLSLFYSVYFVGGWGRTPGQRLAGLIVVDSGDRPVGYMQAVLRYFGTLVAVLPAGLGHLLTLLDKQGRGLGDRVAGTKVIYRGSS